jgi:hypothetical protein
MRGYQKNMNRALEIKKIMLEYMEGMEDVGEWPDEAWEDVEECVNGIYWEEWKGLIDPVLVLEEGLNGE